MSCSPAAGILLLCLLTVLLKAGAQPPPSPELAHIAGSSRKIRMFVKNAFLRLGLDGHVSGVQDDTPETVLQRHSVTVGRVKIQGVTTCMYLCMDICGVPYTSRNFSEECVFNEMIEENHYNSYSSAKYSNSRRTLYLGLNRKGHARRVITRGGVLGRQSTYARVLTQSVAVPPKTNGCPPARGGGTRPPGRCRVRMRRPRRRKRKRCREEEGCTRRRKSRLETAKRIRHRKHRTVTSLEAEEDDDEEEEDVTMTTEEEEEEEIDLSE